MLRLNEIIKQTAQITAISLTIFTLTGGYASAKPYGNFRGNYPIKSTPIFSNTVTQSSSTNTRYNVTIPSGTRIPVTLTTADKIIVTKQETLPVTLVVSGNIQDNKAQTLIPKGSEISGEIKPDGNGSRFFSDTLILPNGDRIPFSATSKVVTRTEVISQGRNTDAIWQGALAGTAAAALLGGITGDKAIATEELLGGAGFGALAGFLLGGNKQGEVISINPEEDLTLTLNSNLSF